MTDDKSVTIDPTTTIGTDVFVNGETQCFNIYYQNEPLPFKKEFNFCLPGSSLKVSNNIYANDCRNPGADAPHSAHYCLMEKCRLLGSFDVELPAPVKSGEPVLVVMEIDAEGIMTCHAECKGKVVYATFTPSPCTNEAPSLKRGRKDPAGRIS